MESSTRQKVARSLATLAVILGEDVSDERLQGYLVVLDDLDGAAIERAIERLSQTARFFPKPAEIRELIEDSGVERAERAWVLLVEAAHQSGDRSVFLEDVTLAQAMLDTFGTWIVAYESLVRMSPEMMTAKRREFVSAYKRGEKHPPSTDVRFQPGRWEINNRETLPNWGKRWIKEGRTEFPFEVVIVRDKVLTSSLRYSSDTAQLTSASKRQLLSGKEPQPLPFKVPPLTLPGASAEAQLMSPEDIKAGIRALTRGASIEGEKA